MNALFDTIGGIRADRPEHGCTGERCSWCAYQDEVAYRAAQPPRAKFDEACWYLECAIANKQNKMIQRNYAHAVLDLLAEADVTVSWYRVKLHQIMLSLPESSPLGENPQVLTKAYSTFPQAVLAAVQSEEFKAWRKQE